MADKAGNQGNQAAAGAGGAVRKVKKPRKTKPKMTGTFKESSAYVDPENTELYNLNYNFTLPDTPGEDVLSFRSEETPLEDVENRLFLPFPDLNFKSTICEKKYFYLVLLED